jgi:hypothetical protein
MAWLLSLVTCAALVACRGRQDEVARKASPAVLLNNSVFEVSLLPQWQGLLPEWQGLS